MSPKASLVVLAAAFAALWSFTGTPPPAAAEPHLSSGHTHDNLTVFVIRGPDVLESKHILTLQEALERNLAVVHETSSVNMLEVENLSVDHELFLQSGDIVKGGKQDRIVSKDLLVAAKSGRVPCPANCCEQSRWQPRGGEVATRFEKSSDFAVGNDIKIANVTGFQGLVWDGVAKKQADLSKNVGKPVTANASPTSLQLALEDKDLRAKMAGYEKSLGGLANAYPDAVGAVVALNGQVIASDVYGSKELFRKAWPKLLKSAAADAVAQLPSAAVVAATREDAMAFLAKREEDEGSASAGGQLAGTIVDGRVINVNDVEQQIQHLAFEAVDTPQRVNAPNAAGFAGRSGATRERTLNSGGGQPRELNRVALPSPNGNPSQTNDNLFQELARNPAGQSSYQLGYRVDTTNAPAAPAVVSFESRAGSQKNALLHRGQLKK